MNRRPAISVFAAISSLILSVSVSVAEQKTAPSAAPSAPAPAAAPAEPSAPAGEPASPAPSAGELQFQTAAQARSHCPGDTVVWANLASKAYHYYGERRYGATKRGAYMCEGDAISAGMKSRKKEKHP